MAVRGVLLLDREEVGGRVQVFPHIEGRLGAPLHFRVALQLQSQGVGHAVDFALVVHPHFVGAGVVEHAGGGLRVPRVACQLLVGLFSGLKSAELVVARRDPRVHLLRIVLHQHVRMHNKIMILLGLILTTIFPIQVIKLQEILKNRRIHLLSEQSLPVLVLGFWLLLFTNFVGLCPVTCLNHLPGAASNFITEHVSLFL